MFGKDANVRWTNTINYLNRHFTCPGLSYRLGDPIKTVVPTGSINEFSGKIALGRHAGAGTEDKRHALRGLLLCQATYFSTPWAHENFVGTPEPTPVSRLPGNWKEQSLAIWGSRSEMEIKSAIAMFVPLPSASYAGLVKAAKAGPPNGVGLITANLALTRSQDCCVGAAETCYRGVLAWLLSSGMVSLRWIARNSCPDGQLALDRMFGKGEVVWPPDRTFDETSVLPHIEAGFVIHMWNELTGPGGWNGHWVISNGDGTFCGVNNGEIDTPTERVLKKYANPRATHR
jgi:hypothetical protein